MPLVLGHHLPRETAVTACRCAHHDDVASAGSPDHGLQTAFRGGESGEELFGVVATAALDRRVGLSSPWDPLVDVLVHSQDIARPLQRRLPTPPDLAVPALEHVWSNVFYGRPARRMSGLRFVATDTAWVGGDGPEVRGRAGDLLLLATGRPVSASGVTGPGAGEAAARLRS